MSNRTSQPAVAPSAVTIGIDVGGTKIAAGLVDAGGTVSARRRAVTPGDDAEAAADVVLETIRDLQRQGDVAGVGIGVPGFVDRATGEVLVTPNFSWPARPMAAWLAETTGLPVVLENDATAAAWGEYRFGAGAGHDEVLTITVGTGIGGGLVLAGAPYRGAHGMSAEVGHLRVVPGGLPCGCGSHGCWEAYASGTALTRRGRELGYADGGAVTAAARDGDDKAVALLGEIGDWLGQGLASLVNVLDPGVVVVGGGLVDAGPLLLEPLRASLSAHLSGGTRPAPPVVPALLGNDAGLVGAADLARG